MKKILLYLLLACSISTFAQAEFPEGIQVTNAQDNTALKVNVQNATGVINWKYLADFQKEKAFLSTGLIKNGLISANGDPTKFNITAGIGIISNFDDPENPTSTIINFPAFTGITPTYLLTGTITYVAINSTPAVVMQATPFTPEQRRSLITLGAVIHSNLTTINVVNNISAPTNATTNQLHDFIEAVGALNLTGNKYTANGANLQLNKSAGLIFKLGSNFANDWKNPHELSQTAGTSLTFRYRTQNGTEGSDRINLDPALYDLNNVLTAVPNNKFTIQTVTMFQSGLTRIQYGQNVYDDLATAKNAVFTRNFVLEPNSKENGIIRAYIIMKNTTTSLQNVADADILEAQKFGGVASGGVALTLANIVTALGYTPENAANKQNSLSVADGSAVKFPTVDAISGGTSYKRTIAQIRVLTGVLPNNNFYTTDLGQEGNWYYDASDTTSADNTGTILVTSDGKRIKRVITTEINAKWFALSGDGIVNDYTNLQSAVNIACSLEKPLYLPKGTYLINTPITATGALIMYGDGKATDSDRGITRIVTNSTTQNALVIDNNGKNIYLHDFSIENLTVSTSITSIGLWIKKANNSVVERLSFINYFDNIYMSGGIYYNVVNCNFFDPVNSGVTIENIYNSDIGDMSFSGNSFLPRFFNSRSPASALLWKSGGGLRFVNNKINWSGSAKFVKGLIFRPSAGVNTSVFLINSNSLENTTSDMIYFGGTHLSNTVDYSLGKIIITSNELGLVGSRGIKFEFANRNVAGKSIYYVSGVEISGNYISGTVGIELFGISDINVGSNQYSVSQSVCDVSSCSNISYLPGNVTLLTNPAGVRLFSQSLSDSKTQKGNKIFNFSSILPSVINSSTWTSLFSIEILENRGVFLEVALNGLIEGSGLKFSQTLKRYINKNANGTVTISTPYDSDFIFSDDLEFRVNNTTDKAVLEVKNKITSGTSNNGLLKINVTGDPKTITQFNIN